MEKRFLINFINENVAIGIDSYRRTRPYFFFGVLLEVNDDSILLELEHKKGFKTLHLTDIVDVHFDKRYQEGQR